jgi:ABC-type glucose/galactose transport system permease subunit
MRLSSGFNLVRPATYNLLIRSFVFRDALADAVLLTIDYPLLCLGEMAVILRHVSLFAILHAGLAIFQVGSLLRGRRFVLHAIANALLLVFFARVNFVNPRMARIDNARARA